MGKPDNKELIRIAAEIGAKTAIDRWEKEKEKEKSEQKDRRLHNTLLLLKNYRLFRDHAKNAVFQAEQMDESIYDILESMERKTSNLFVDSIKSSAMRTAMLVRHIEVMLGLYRVYCENSRKPEDLRRWRVIEGLYVADKELSVLDLADRENVAKRTVERDVTEACEHLAALIFGIDGIRKS